MEVKRLQVKDFLVAANGAIVIDVRSPSEYNHAQLPGAYSLPLFTDEERKEVGTAYKQQSREMAINIGLDFFGPKMRKMVEEVEELVRSSKLKVQKGEVVDIALQADEHPSQTSLYVYCWRGGMRSAAVAWLLQLYGYKVHTLAGGYKAFRNHVLQTLAEPFHLQVVGGYTGSGKTEVLQVLKQKGEPVVDLEGIACHKGSAFGNINMPKQPSQEMFENILATELLALKEKNNSAIWLEDESQRIGLVNIPAAFWKNMRSSPVFFLDIPFEERLNHIVEEYGKCDKEKLADAIQRITKRLGGLETKNALLFLEEGNLKECFSILLHYYDKQYSKGLHNRTDIESLLHNIPCNTVTPANANTLLDQQVVI